MSVVYGAPYGGGLALYQSAALKAYTEAIEKDRRNSNGLSARSKAALLDWLTENYEHAPAAKHQFALFEKHVLVRARGVPLGFWAVFENPVARRTTGGRTGTLCEPS